MNTLKKIMSLFLLLISPFELTCLRTSDICSLVKSVDMRCDSQDYSYRCDTKYCAKTEKSCQELNDLNYYIGSIQSHSKKDKFDKLIKSIKKCTTRSDSADICLSSFSCSNIHRMESLQDSVFVGIKIPSYCPCNHQRQKYACDTKFCATSKETCNDFIRLRKDTDKIKKCGNFE